MDEKHVVACFLKHGDKIPIFRRSNKVGTYSGKWAGVSGYLEKGVTAYEQAICEIEEETGLNSEDVDLLKEGIPLEVIDDKLDRKWVIHAFLFQIKEPGKIRLDWEHTDMKWIYPPDLSDYDTVPKLLQTWDTIAP